MTDLGVHHDLEVGRSASPPGRESREDWRGRGQEKNGRLLDNDKKKNSRSRSRSPVRKRRKSYSPSREMRYSRDGTNTTSREPHLERGRLFVGNIETRCHRKDLIKLFAQYGDVLGVSVHKGFAFVQMDREKTANKAINHEDTKVFMGSKIHVEFSQAALKAGAKFERLFLFGSPPRPLPPPRDRSASLATDPYVEEQERMREERLSRILRMERELAILRSREEDVLNPKPVFRPPPPVDSHDRDTFYHRSPAPHPSVSPSGYQSSYSRERDSGAAYHHGTSSDGAAGSVDRARAYYKYSSPPREYTTARAVSGNVRPYRDSVSYPQISSSGSGGYSRGVPAVGYNHGGSSAGSTSGGLNASLPPGWASGDKPPVNRPPFSVGPWS